MRKVFLFVIGIMFLANLAWGAAATVTKTEWGYLVKGGTSETLISVDDIRIKMIAFSAAVANDTAVFKSGAVSSTAFQMKSTGVSNPTGNYLYFGPDGAIFKWLSVTMSNSVDEVYLYW